MITTQLATTHAQVEEAVNFRFKYMCEWNNYYPFTRPEQIEDEFDEYTDYLVCKNLNEDVLGVVRLIRPSEHGFFLERFVSLEPYNIEKKNTLEFSECIVNPSFRNDSKIVLSLIISSFDYLNEKRYKSGISVSVKSMAKFFEKIGFTNTGVSTICGWQKEVTLMIMKNPTETAMKIERYRQFLI